MAMPLWYSCVPTMQARKMLKSAVRVSTAQHNIRRCISVSSSCHFTQQLKNHTLSPSQGLLVGGGGVNINERRSALIGNSISDGNGGLFECGGRKMRNVSSGVYYNNNNYYCTTTSSSAAENETETETEEEEPLHTIITESESVTGSNDKHEFQAETRQLLDIVAKSLYSESEVFIRELISNASDALEKLRYVRLTRTDLTDSGMPLEIHLQTNKENNIFIIQDTGIGLTKEEMITNLGTIARSGSKEFVKELREKGASGEGGSIIGQFGVGFYSAFMVGDNVEVFSRSHEPGAPGYHWSSAGTGSYEIAEADGVQQGTKIIVHLKDDCKKFSDDENIKGIITKYSNFVGVPIYLNGKRVNTVEALWMKETKDISTVDHEQFFQYISNSAYDTPRYTLQYKTDAPINIRCLLYVPSREPSLFEFSRHEHAPVALYSRKILIQPKADKILPVWLRFMTGVVDSEDIPLNLSRELLQDSALLTKIRNVLVARILKFFQDKSKKDKKSYADFFKAYGLYFREGVVSTPEQSIREDISKLLRFESSAEPAGTLTGITDYCDRMKAGERNIYYLTAPSRQVAEASPYLEALKQNDVEVLFCFEPYDDLVLMQLQEFDRKKITSIENMPIESQEKPPVDEQSGSPDLTLSPSDCEDLMKWMETTLGSKVNSVKTTNRLATHPAVVTLPNMGAARHWLKTALKNEAEENKYKLLELAFEINPGHSLVRKIQDLRTREPELAEMVLKQVYGTAMINAGLVEDPRLVLGDVNQLMTKILEKY